MSTPGWERFQRIVKPEFRHGAGWAGVEKVLAATEANLAADPPPKITHRLMRDHMISRGFNPDGWNKPLDELVDPDVLCEALRLSDLSRAGLLVPYWWLSYRQGGFRRLDG